MFRLLATTLLFVGCSDSGGGAPVIQGLPSSSTDVTTSPSAPAGKRYVDLVFSQLEAQRDVVYATAPDLQTGAIVSLKLDWFAPAADAASSRPAIVWIHGGGFVSGSKADTTATAEEYAKRGYVSVSINYRLGGRDQCAAAQDPSRPESERAVAETRCRESTFAPQHDAQAAVRWLRANAAALRIDTDRVAVGGFSAGAFTALQVAQRSEDPGDVGDNDSYSSKIAAVLSASGFSSDDNSIDATDAPVFLLASENDAGVSFSSVQATERRIHEVGGTAETMYFTAEAAHGKFLYLKYIAEVDAAWTAFLLEHLRLA